MKMKKPTLALLAVIFAVHSAFAIDVVIEPPRAHIPPGGEQIFTAMAFDDNGEIIPVEEWEWRVRPTWIGSITDEGVFTAAHRPSHGMVTAAFYLDEVRYVGRARVFIERERYRVLVRPRNAFLMPGEAVQYEAWVVTNFGDSIGGLSFEWDVEPAWLGAITDDGLFTAGDQTGRGSVIATTTLEDRTLRGAGFVAISEMGWGSIAGTVTDEEGNAIPRRARVALFIPPHRDPIRTVSTQLDGAYLFESVLPGSYCVRAGAPGFLPEFYDDSPGIEGATPVPVEGGSVTEGIDFALALGGVIAGRVTAENNDIPLPHAHVTAFRIRPDPFHRCAPVDRHGFYALDGLPPGLYIVRANADGFIPEFWEEARFPENADPIAIEIASVVEGIDFTLEPRWPPLNGHLSGIVTDDSTGAPIEGAHITLFRLGPRPIMMFHQRTRDDGTFGFEHLPYGEYIVLCGARGYIHEYYDGVPRWWEATVLTVGPDSAPEIAIALAPRIVGGLCAFTGIVRDANGNPLEGVLIRAEGSITATTETGVDGRYCLNIAEGEYVLAADRASLATRYYPNAPDPSQATVLTVSPTSPEVEADFSLDEALGCGEEETACSPAKFAVSAIYPNPFNATTRISFEMPAAGQVKLAVYDVLGREVAVLVNAMQPAGTQSITFDGINLATGVYFVRLSGPWGAATCKMLLLK